nr:prolyl oligopeptidase family serine peptidase [Acidobacteriota bacterium]
YLTGDPSSPATIEEKTKSSFANIAWAPDGSHLTWLQTVKAEESKKPAAYDLHLLQIDKLKRHQASDIPSGWHIPSQSKLQWTEDNQRLFFGLRPTPKDAEVEEEVKKEKEKEEMSEDDSEADMYDIESIRKKNELDVWHHKDKRIKTVVKTSWKETSKRTFAAVFHIKSKKTVQLADETIPSVNFTQNAQGVLAATNVPHARKLLWTGNMTDLYHIDLQNGKRTLIQEKFQQNGAWTLSPGGRYIAYMKDDKVFLLDVRRNRTRILNEGLDVSFFDEDHDRPSKARGYGFGGWVKDDAAVLAYDKYDIWVFPTREKETPYQLTGNVGRTKDLRFRVRDLREKGRTYFEPDERLLLESYNYEEKNYGYYAAELGKQNVHPRLEGPKRYRFKVKAERADKIVYSQESFEEFPDLWVSDSMLNGPRRLSTENPQISEFIWGKPELVSWTSMDGKPLKGVLIKPENYQEGKRYPVLVYYYRFFSQRMYEFNEMVVNHRPNFPFYTSNGYCVFLPDIHFTVGEPGMSAVRSLVPGVQKLIDMGVADPEAVGLHGHSWSGYQSAYVVTQTDMFACTIAGAPVGNMTSAYTGIRLGSGWGRLFQYERGQSRLGGSLWERRDLYIENSPVFFADRINTPTLIMFGDEDTAVPWQQGVELYLAMRRLGKDVIFLQYHGEPHHLKKYPNKVDYTLKMKEYLDHYLKGEPPAPWISEGVPYKGK